MRRMLESENHTVVEAADGNAGIEAFRNEAPDVVITDIIMPNADGLEVARQILEMNPEAKIIAISGGGRLAEDTYLNFARKFGVAAVLAKPFSPNELLTLVDGVQGQAAAEAAIP